MYNEISRDALLISLSNIISGLLASGHYTQCTRDYFEEYESPKLKMYDYGKEWKSDNEELDLGLTARYTPHVILEAEGILIKSLKINGLQIGLDGNLVMKCWRHL